MRTISMMFVFAVCFFSTEFAQADCGGGTQATCGNSTAHVRTAVRQRVGILARISQASRSSCSGAAVRSCGQSAQSCGGSQSVQSCETQVNACNQSTQPNAVTFGCDASLGSGQAVSNNDIAYAKSVQQAQNGRMRHVGGSMGTGRYEGVGMSSISAEDAIQRACYHGQKQVVGQSVVQGSNGMFYATVLYN